MHQNCRLLVTLVPIPCYDSLIIAWIMKTMKKERKKEIEFATHWNFDNTVKGNIYKNEKLRPLNLCSFKELCDSHHIN